VAGLGGARPSVGQPARSRMKQSGPRSPGVDCLSAPHRADAGPTRQPVSLLGLGDQIRASSFPDKLACAIAEERRSELAEARSGLSSAFVRVPSSMTHHDHVSAPVRNDWGPWWGARGPVKRLSAVPHHVPPPIARGSVWPSVTLRLPAGTKLEERCCPPPSAFCLLVQGNARPALVELPGNHSSPGGRAPSCFLARRRRPGSRCEARRRPSPGLRFSLHKTQGFPPCASEPKRRIFFVVPVRRPWCLPLCIASHGGGPTRPREAGGSREPREGGTLETHSRRDVGPNVVGGRADHEESATHVCERAASQRPDRGGAAAGKNYRRDPIGALSGCDRRGASAAPAAGPP